MLKSLLFYTTSAPNEERNFCIRIEIRILLISHSTWSNRSQASFDVSRARSMLGGETRKAGFTSDVVLPCRIDFTDFTNNQNIPASPTRPFPPSPLSRSLALFYFLYRILFLLFSLVLFFFFFFFSFFFLLATHQPSG